jgi:hypothetical protein
VVPVPVLPKGHPRGCGSSQLQSKNNFARGLFVFSNEVRDRWHFVNVRHEAGEDHRSIRRRMTVGPEERLRTASERIAKMRLGAGAARTSALEIQNLHNDALDVEQITKRFFDDYTKAHFDLQEVRCVLRRLQPQ